MIAFVVLITAIISFIAYLITYGSSYLSIITDFIGNGMTFFAEFRELGPEFLSTFIAILVFFSIIALVIRLIPFIG